MTKKTKAHGIRPPARPIAPGRDSIRPVGTPSPGEPVNSLLRYAYEQAFNAGTARVAENPPSAGNELAWQARWFSGACGRAFTTTSGAQATVIDFGEWNREAGPDFVRATVRLDGHEHRGAIEVDLAASGWEQHHHAINPDYADVVLHVIVNRPSKRHFSRTAHHREVAQICLADHHDAAPEWDSVAAARPGRCTAPLRALSADQLSALLAVASRRRLARKGAVLASMVAARGVDAALFEALAVTLCYKNNKLPFQLLAQRVPLKIAACARGEALLFGMAGFLEKPEPPPGAARQEAAALWSMWWKLRAAHTHAIFAQSAWKLGGIRPANHPLRRLAALAAIAQRWKSVRTALQSGDPAHLQETLCSLEHPFWSFHTSWTSPRRQTPLALLGPDRVREIYANVVLPLALSRGQEPQWCDLPAGPSNATLKIVSARLFGGPLPRHLPKRLFIHQGLLQIYTDFCLRDHGECAQCRFPSLVADLPA